VEQGWNRAFTAGPDGGDTATAGSGAGTAAGDLAAKLRSQEYSYNGAFNCAFSTGPAGKPWGALSHRLPRTRRCKIQEAFNCGRKGCPLCLAKKKLPKNQRAMKNPWPHQIWREALTIIYRLTIHKSPQVTFVHPTAVPRFPAKTAFAGCPSEHAIS
jgi:hypothetical protein